MDGRWKKGLVMGFIQRYLEPGTNSYKLGNGVKDQNVEFTVICPAKTARILEKRLREHVEYQKEQSAFRKQTKTSSY